MDLPRPLDSAEGFGDSGRVWPGVGEGSLRLAARVGPEPESTSEGFCYDTPSHRLIVEERPDGWTVVIHRDGEFERWASFDRDLRAGEVVVSPRAAERGLSPIAHPLDELLVLHRVVRSGGLLLRGRLVACGSHGLVVTSHPGAVGGSVGRPRRSAWEPRPLVLVRPKDGTFWAECWPWSDAGPRSSVGPLPLAAVHTASDRATAPIVQLDADAAVATLLDHAVMPFHDALFPSYVFDTAAVLAGQLPILQLHAPRTRSVRGPSEAEGAGPMAAMPFGR